MQPSIPSPGDFIRDELKKRLWSQEDLSQILGRTTSRISELLKGTQVVSPEIAHELETAFGIPAAVWMQREAEYRLSIVKPKTDAVRRKAALYELAPIREMQKRGWIGPHESVEGLERELREFFGVSDLSSDPLIEVAMRKSAPDQKLTPAQRAWCVQVRALAHAMVVPRYDESRLRPLSEKLRKLAAFPQEARKVPSLLASYGIRFVIVEPLTGGGVDGVAMWLDENSPVVGMSIRYDRIDNFWFTLIHEMSHIENRDLFHVDNDPQDTTDIEARANNDAADLLVPPEMMKSFITRTSPMYRMEQINQFANRVKIHPGIIVGQLQKRKEIGYHSGRETLVKIRKTVTSTAITDGWGQTISPEVLE